MGLYKVKKDFESPSMGVFIMGEDVLLPDNEVKGWVASGLLEEIKKKDKPEKGGL